MSLVYTLNTKAAKTLDTKTQLCYYSLVQIRTVREAKSSFILQHSVFEVLFTLFLKKLMKEGTIARLTDRGFGFIAQEGVEKDLFFHSSELVDVQYNDLKEGDKVTFDIGEGQKGPNATNVQLAN